MPQYSNNAASWWRKRTTMERILLLLGICSTILIIALIVSLCILHKGDNSSICMTPGCVHTASRILEYMNPDVQPCEDFYRFSCGSFLRNANIRDDQLDVSSSSLVLDNIQFKLRAILEEPIKSDDIKPFKMAKDLYKGCMNKALAQSRGTQQVLKALNSFGGWPVLVGPNWDDSTFTWQKTVKDFRKKGYDINYILNIEIVIDFIDPFKTIFLIDQASLGLSHSLLLYGMKGLFVTAYYDYMVDIAVLLGAPRERAAVELKDSLLFEISLANISAPNERVTNLSTLYNPRTIAELQTEYPSISWLEYINDLLPAGLQVTRDEVVIITSPTYLKDLEKLLKDTPKRVLANYLMWRLTSWSVPFLREEFRKREFEYSTYMFETTEREPTWKECVEKVYENVYVAVGSMYVQKYFNKDAKRIAVEMVNGIREEFINILENVDWMDEDTRKHALEKAHSMTAYIAYPDEILDHNKLEEYYNDLEVDEYQFMKSVLNIKFFDMNNKFNQLRKPVNKSDYPLLALLEVNAYHHPLDNSITIPAGILQDVFFSVDRPSYMNYGAIGATIGHEITHGFGERGGHFNKDGNLVDWWNQPTTYGYTEKVNCIIKQYENYTIKKSNLNLTGSSTEEENAADNGGIKVAYLAYTKWVQRNGEEPQLPGLEYTPRQMFWISAGMKWCTKNKPESLKDDILTDEHSPAEFRVLGPLSNMDEFAKDFQCPAGSPMNPHHKCKIW